MKQGSFLLLGLLLIAACGGGGGGGARAGAGASTAAADTTAPTIDSFAPADDATAVALAATISVTFSEAVDEATITNANLDVEPSASSDGTTDVCTIWSLNDDDTVATCTHGDLAPGVDYTITVSANVTDAAGNALSETTAEFTTTGTAGANTPVATIVVPSFDVTGDDELRITFDQAVDSATINTDNVEVTRDGETANLCSAVTLSDDGLTAFCTLSETVACDDTPTKFNVTLNADIRSDSGDHAILPLDDYFSNIDDGFANAATVGTGSVCWTASEGSDGLVDAGETMDSDTTNAGQLTISSDASADVTQPGDVGGLVAKEDVTMGGAFGVTAKIDVVSGGSAAAERVAFALTDDVTTLGSGTEETFFVHVRADEYGARAIDDGGAEQEGSDAAACSGCLDTTPVYFCMTRDADGNLTASYDEDGTGTFTSLDAAGFAFPTITDPIGLFFRINYDAIDIYTLRVDWVRFNIGEAECPAVDTVE